MIPFDGRRTSSILEPFNPLPEGRLMPELPELEVVREVPERRVVGTTIETVEVLPPGGPIVVRDLAQIGFSAILTGAAICRAERRGKYVILWLAGPGDLPRPPYYLVINPKLMGRLQLTTPAEKRRAKTHVVLSLSSGDELRYIDQNQMGQLYLTGDLAQIPDFAKMGPEPSALSMVDFLTRLRSISR